MTGMSIAESVDIAAEISDATLLNATRKNLSRLSVAVGCQFCV
jgi:hypothetical protein